MSQAPANNNELILQAPDCVVQCYSIILLISQLLPEKTSSFARDHSAGHILWRIIEEKKQKGSKLHIIAGNVFNGLGVWVVACRDGYFDIHKLAFMST